MDDNNDDKIFLNDIVGSADFIKFLLNENKILTSLAPDTNVDVPILKSKNVLFTGVYVSLPISDKNEINLINDIQMNSKFLGIVSIKKNDKDIYEIGTTAQILKTVKINEDKIQVILQGVDKFKIENLYTDVIGNLCAKGRILKDCDGDRDSLQYKAIELNIKQLVGEMIDLHPNFPNEIKAFIEISFICSKIISKSKLFLLQYSSYA